MGKPKKLNTKKIKKLHKQLYETGKYVSKEEYLVSSFSKKMKRLYDSLPPERQKSLVRYILSDEEWDRTEDLRSSSEKHKQLQPSKTIQVHTLREFAQKRGKRVKQKKRKVSKVIKDSKGLLRITNPEASDTIILSSKQMKKKIKKEMKQNQSKFISLDLDFSDESIESQIFGNSSVNQIISDNFFNSYGY